MDPARGVCPRLFREQGTAARDECQGHTHKRPRGLQDLGDPQAQAVPRRGGAGHLQDDSVPQLLGEPWHFGRVGLCGPSREDGFRPPGLPLDQPSRFRSSAGLRRCRQLAQDRGLCRGGYAFGQGFRPLCEAADGRCRGRGAPGAFRNGNMGLARAGGRRERLVARPRGPEGHPGCVGARKGSLHRACRIHRCGDAAGSVLCRQRLPDIRLLFQVQFHLSRRDAGSGEPRRPHLAQFRRCQLEG